MKESRATRDEQRVTAATPLTDEQVWGEPIERCVDCLNFVPREGADVRDWGWCIAGGAPPRGGEYMRRLPNQVSCRTNFAKCDPGTATRDTAGEIRARGE